MNSSFTEEKKQMNLQLTGDDIENESEKDAGAGFTYQQTHSRNCQKWPKKNQQQLRGTVVATG